jgi:hypothetical protein
MCDRFEYPEDRFIFMRWVVARGPCARPYWLYDQHASVLIIELKRRGRVLCLNIPTERLHNSRSGWRCEVAHSVRQVRAAFKESEK